MFEWQPVGERLWVLKSEHMGLAQLTFYGGSGYLLTCYGQFQVTSHITVDNLPAAKTAAIREIRLAVSEKIARFQSILKDLPPIS